jgi:hypothetical protein
VHSTRQWLVTSIECEPSSSNWVRNEVIHPTIQFRVLINSEFDVYFFFLLNDS